MTPLFSLVSVQHLVRNNPVSITPAQHSCYVERFDELTTLCAWQCLRDVHRASAAKGLLLGCCEVWVQQSCFFHLEPATLPSPLASLFFLSNLLAILDRQRLHVVLHLERPATKSKFGHFVLAAVRISDSGIQHVGNEIRLQARHTEDVVGICGGISGWRVRAANVAVLLPGELSRDCCPSSETLRFNFAKCDVVVGPTPQALLVLQSGDEEC